MFEKVVDALRHYQMGGSMSDVVMTVKQYVKDPALLHVRSSHAPVRSVQCAHSLFCRAEVSGIAADWLQVYAMTD